MKSFMGWKAKDQRQAFEQAAAQLGWASHSVEKDLWVTWALAELFSLPSLTGHLTFKGGTSLSKAWGLIERFSEDIDLTVHRDYLGFGGNQGPEHAPSGKQAQARLEALRMACQKHVQETVKTELDARLVKLQTDVACSIESDTTDKSGQTLLLHYRSCFDESGPSYVAPVVKMEFGARADPWPAELKPVQPRMSSVLPDLFPETELIQVHALEPVRTFWEKAMLLHEEHFRPGEKQMRARLARHYYDLHCLIRAGVAEEAMERHGLFEDVAAHRKIYFRQNWVDYSTLKPGSLSLLPSPSNEAAWRADYRAMRDMLPDDAPKFETMLTSVADFEARFNARKVAT